MTYLYDRSFLFQYLNQILHFPTELIPEIEAEVDE